MNHKLKFNNLLRYLIFVTLISCCSGSALDAQVWIGGFSDQWFHAANWSDGTIPLQPDDDVVIGAPSPTILQQHATLNSIVVGPDGILTVGVGNFPRVLEFGGTAIATLDNAGTINVVDLSRVQFQNDVFNSGTINVTSDSISAKIEVDNVGATVTGGGTIRLSGTTPLIGNVLGSSTFPILTIEDQTVEGSGNFGGGEIGIINSVDSLINANVNGQRLRLIAHNSEGIVNNGMIAASNGGTLEIWADIANNGIIEARDSSTVELRFGGIAGGTIRSEGSGQFQLGSNIKVEDLVIDTPLIVLPGRTLSIAGTVANQSDIAIQGPDAVTFASIGFHADATLTGGGTIHMSGRNAAIVGASRTLTLGNQTIIGEGKIGRGFLTNLIDSPTSTIDANVPGRQLDVNVGEPTVLSVGTLRASNGGLLVFEERLVTEGMIHVEEGSVVEVDSLVIAENGRVSGSGRIRTERIGETISAIHGIMAPGAADATGTLELFYGNLGAIMFPTAGLEIDIASEFNFDNLLVAAGTFTANFNGIDLGGTLSVNLVDGYLPAGDDTFQIVSADISPFCSPLDCVNITRFSNTGLQESVATADGEGTFDVDYGFNHVILRNFNPTNSGSTLDDGRLLVIGTSEIDDIRVSSTGVPGEVQVFLNGSVEDFTGVTDITVQAYSADDIITVSLGSSFNSVNIRGGQGDDLITLNGSTPGVIRGDRGDDVIFGGSGPDDIYGDDGIDEIYGRGGADFIDAGYEFSQEPGIHHIEGGSGRDVIIGSIGDDDIFGNDGADIIEGLNGDDVINGGLGNDSLAGGLGTDVIRGGSGNDEIRGGNGDDLINGDLGLDNLFGGSGDDVVYGGGGADVLNGGSGHDQLFGGPGADRIFGGPFDDFISGGDGPDELFGNIGNDTIHGNAGNDRLSGGTGVDSLHGGLGIDTGLDTGETETGIEN